MYTLWKREVWYNSNERQKFVINTRWILPRAVSVSYFKRFRFVPQNTNTVWVLVFCGTEPAKNGHNSDMVFMVWYGCTMLIVLTRKYCIHVDYNVYCFWKVYGKERSDIIPLKCVFCDVSTRVNHKSVYGSMKTVDFVFVNID